MKKLITLTGIASIGVVLALISACETTSAGGGAASQPGTTTTTTRQTTTTAATTADHRLPNQSIGYEDIGAGGSHSGGPGAGW